MSVVPTADYSAETREALKALGIVALTPDLVAEPRSWLVEGLWPEAALGFIGGPPKAGKSWHALDFGLAVCTGQDFLGWAVPAPGPVLYFVGEEHLGDVLSRADRLLEGHLLDRSDLGERFQISEMSLNLESERVQEQMIAVARNLRPRLIVIDPLVRFLDKAEENSVTEMRKVTRFLKQGLSRDCHTAVAIVHHTDKKGSSLRGTGDLRALSEVTLLFGEASKTGETTIDVEVRMGRPPDAFRARLVDLPGGAVAWRKVDGLSTQDAKVRKALLEALHGRLTQTEIRERAHIRNQDVRPALERIGARQGADRKWSLDDGSTHGSAAEDGAVFPHAGIPVELPSSHEAEVAEEGIATAA